MIPNQRNHYFDRLTRADCSMLKGATPLAHEIVARCWCDPRVTIEIDTKLAEVFAEKIAEYIAALQWCGGSADFAPGGQARKGWEKSVLPLITKEVL